MPVRTVGFLQSWGKKRKMSNLISREAILKHIEKTRQDVQFMDDIQEASIIMNGTYLCEEAVRNQTSAQPEISRIEQELHGKTPEEQYEFLYWLLLKFGLAYTDSRLAVIEWLRGE